MAGQRPKLVVKKATYGHPRGVIRGRGAFDVTEYLQARIDDGGGNYLEIRSDEVLADVLGDPCAGVSKTLVVHYEVLGRQGQVKQLEARGKLQHAVELASTPCVAPLLLIEKATYGLSENDLQARAKALHKELKGVMKVSTKHWQFLFCAPVNRDKALHNAATLPDEKAAIGRWLTKAAVGPKYVARQPLVMS